MSNEHNADEDVVLGFGQEWGHFDQSVLEGAESLALFEQYFEIFPWQLLSRKAVGADIGCGSGRWAVHAAPRVSKLHCVDPSETALDVARRNLILHSNCEFHHCDASSVPVADESLDFLYSLGVLHHIPDPARALRDCVRKLKRGAPILVYLYYALDNRPAWFRALWKATDIVRKIVSRLPFRPRLVITTLIASIVYWPLARTALLLERVGLQVTNLPLSMYRSKSFYTMRTDALDRFGTKIEQRFTASEIVELMTSAGLRDIQISPNPPYWCAVGFRGN